MSKRKSNDHDDGIAKSKLLRSKGKSAKTRNPRSSSAKDKGPRLCGNGKPMPSLAELEKMFEDSDGDDDSTEVSEPAPAPVTPRSKTPDQPLNISNDKLMSPSTIKIIADKVMDFVCDLTDSLRNGEDGPPLPIIPQKKRKKSGIPHIIGSTKREQVEFAPRKNCFCIGDTNYGIDYSNNSIDEEDNDEAKCGKRSKVRNVSKSIFNAKSDEIAERLKELENDSSNSSTATVAYEYMGTVTTPARFSPLPSTSNDEETFRKNQQLLNESQMKAELYDSDSTVIDEPSEVISLDDYVIKNTAKIKSSNNSVVEIVDGHINRSKIEPTNDSIIEVLEVNSTIIDSPISIIDDDEVETNLNDSTENKVPTKDDVKYDDIYKDIDTTQLTDIDTTIDITGIDIDDIIAETNAVLNKFTKKHSDPIAVVSSSVVLNTTNGKRNSQVNIENNSVVADAIIIEDVSPITSGSASRTPRKRRTSVVDLTSLSIPVIEVQPPLVVINNNVESLVVTNEIPKSPTFSPQKPNTPEKSTRSAQRPTNNHISSPEPAAAPTGLFGDCPICMEVLVNTNIASTICGHIFCLQCIKTSLISNGKRCPKCRKPLKGKNSYHQLFL